MDSTNWDNAASSICTGKVGILPTDTIYGLVASALNQEAVERIYKLKGRAFDKPCIILVAKPDDIAQFGVDLGAINKAQTYWPGPVSVVLPLDGYVEKLQYLHRGQQSLAFRFPAHKKLRQLLAQTGPIIAPSANPEGSPSAKTITEAQKYFGEDVDFYVDGGILENSPSQLISLLDDKPQRLR